MNAKKIQHLADEFNKQYWVATATSDPGDYFRACLLGRQLVKALGDEQVVNDLLLDPTMNEFKNEIARKAKENEKIS